MTEDEKLDYIKDILLTPRKDRKHGEFRFIETYFENYHYFQRLSKKGIKHAKALCRAMEYKEVKKGNDLNNVYLEEEYGL